MGVTLFALGFGLNVHSDRVLRSLRAPGETGYRIPFGGGFAYVSAPNYLGEILEWLGFALAAQTLAAWAFAAFTVANLAPRALSNHRWYRERFPDYPLRRRALIPFPLVTMFRFPGRDFLQLRRDPLGFFTRIHEERGDVARFSVPGRRLVLLGHPDHARDVLLTHAARVEKGPALRSTRVLLGDGLLTSEGAVHLEHRRRLQPAFHRSELFRYVPGMCVRPRPAPGRSGRARRSTSRGA